MENVKRAEVELSPAESFAEMFEGAWAKDPSLTGKLVKGKIVAVTNNAALVDVKLKSEGAVQLEEFGSAEPKVGDEIEVFVESFDGRSGVLLSLERAKRMRMWKQLESLHKEGKSTAGKITGRVKGGFSVSLDGTFAFLPGSHLDIRPVRDPKELMGMDLEFIVIKMDKTRDSIVVSRRLALEKVNSGSRQRLLENIKEGDTVDGIVRSITDYGAFVDLGGVDGLLHITDMSWGRVTSPSEVVQIGQKITIKVKSYDREKVHIGLSLKEFAKDPWEDIKQKYPDGKRVKGRVCHVEDYGAFVELENGIKGLVHVSEMRWTRRNLNPGKLVSLSQEVEVEVLGVDADKRRIGLGMKQCLPNPWKDFAAAHKAGERVKGLVRKAKSQNFFLLDLGKDIDGMIHAGDLTWDLPPQQAIKKYNEGDEIEAVILYIDADNERISLGVKQLAKDPFTDLATKVKKGDLFTCTVKSGDSGGLLVETQNALVGVIPPSEISRSSGVTVRNFPPGERVDAQVLKVDKRARRLVMSIKARERSEEKEAIKKYGSADSGATLGDILGKAIENRKTGEEGGAETAEETTEKTAEKTASEEGDEKDGASGEQAQEKEPNKEVSRPQKSPND